MQQRVGCSKLCGRGWTFLICLVGLSLLGPLLPAKSTQDVVLYQEGFETGEAEGWYLHGNWAVVIEADGNHTLRGGEGGRATYTRDDWGDFTLSLRLTIRGGQFTVLFRRSGCLQYGVTLDAGEEEITLSKISLGCVTHSELRRAHRYFSPGRWYAVQVDARGGRITVSVDGWQVLSFNDPFPLPSGKLTLEAHGREVDCRVDDIVLQGPGASPAGTVWTRTGGPPGGMGYDVRIDRQNPSIIYVTCAFAGLHKSVDGGETWVPMNEGIMSHAGASGHAVPVFCVTIDPSDSDTLWVGTVDSKGIYRSTDGGTHWELRVNGISSFPPDHVPTARCFAVDPRDSRVVFAALEIADHSKGSSYGQIYRTSNSGLNWSLVLEARNLFRRIEIDPQNPSIVYAGTGIFDREGEFEGIFKSTDSGFSWTKINSGLTNLIAPYLALSPADPNVLYAATGRERSFGGRDDGGVFVSRDAGASWQKILTPSYGVVGAVAVAPSDAQRVYAAIEEHFYRSTDGGHTWRDMGFNLRGFKMGIPIALDVHPTDPETVYLNSYGGGIWRSTDGGQSWQSANRGYTGAHVHDIVVDPQSRDRIYVSAGSGVFRSDDGGVYYQGLLPADIRFGLPRVMALDPHDSQTIYAGDGWGNHLFRSLDLGQTWTRLGRISPEFDAILSQGGPSVQITEILLSPRDSQTIYISTTVGSPLKPDELGSRPGLGIYRSIDGGTTWRRMSSGLPSGQVLCLVMDPTDPSTLYAGTFSGGVAKSVDGGESWKAMNTGLASLEIRSLLVDPRNPAIVLAGTRGAGLFKSTDGGLRWKWSGVGMDAEANVRSIVVNGFDSKEIYAATIGGVFRSADGGETWHGFNWGLRNRAIHTLAISSDGSRLYAGTEGDGVYRFQLK